MAKWDRFRGVRLRELDKKQLLGEALPGLSFTLDENEMAALSQTFAAFPGAIEKAALHATDRTRIFLRKELIRGFREMLTLKPAYIAKGIKTSRAKLMGQRTEAEVRIATRNIPLGRYRVNPETPPPLKGIPVKARQRVSYALRIGGPVHGDEPRDSTAPPEASRIFVAKMASDHIGVFYRTARGSRGAIKQEYAPSLQYHAKADGFLEGMSALAAARFRDVFVSEASKITGVF